MQGKIAGIALKPEHRGPMVEVDEAMVDEKGLAGNVASAAQRRITFICRDQWAETTAKLDTDLPWRTCRAKIPLETVTDPDAYAKLIDVLEWADQRSLTGG